MNRLYRTLFTLAVAGLSFSALADPKSLLDPLFLDDELLQVTITAPLTTLVRERPKDDYLPGVIRYLEPDGTAVDLDLEAVSSDLDQQRSNRQEFQELNVRISIEQQLGSDQNDRISLFQLPEEVGGKLEEVREVVAAAILMNVDAGQDIGQALTFFAEGDTHFNNQEYSDAFASYRQAYREAAQAGAQPGLGQKK